MRKAIVIAGACAAFMSFGATAPEAQFQTGERLYADCTASLPDRQWQLKNAYCMAYVMGVVDALAEYEKVNEKMSSGRSAIVRHNLTRPARTCARSARRIITPTSPSC